MRSVARVAGHPLHPMLVTVPAGGFALVLLCDLIFVATDARMWWQATVPILILSVLGALVAAIPGLIDLASVAARQGALGVGLAHMGLNLALVAVQAFNLYVRLTAEQLPPTGPGAWLWLSVLAIAIMGVSGLLGWRMVQYYHVGVLEHPEARDPDPQLRELPPGEPLLR